ncbi:MAG: hypothetical protein K0S43_2670, partial [Cellulosimicrobium sp.]|nr:hypothetical protein [Cellulosimicrobium sp.]
MSHDPTPLATAVRAPRRPTTMKEQPVPTTHRRAAAGGLAALTVTGLVLSVAAAPAATAAPVTAPLLAPYWTELDLTGDDQVTVADLDVVTAALGGTADDAAWDGVAAADTDGDDTITVADLAAVSQRMIYVDGPFELVEASVLDMQAAMNAGVTSSVAITQEYLDRIAAYDDAPVSYPVDPANPGGAKATTARALNSIITTSTVALDAAKAADAKRAESGMTSMLLGVPIAVKDNYDTIDMVTTGGCGCWDGNQTATDAHMVEGLRADGAV